MGGLLISRSNRKASTAGKGWPMKRRILLTNEVVHRLLPEESVRLERFTDIEDEAAETLARVSRWNRFPNAKLSNSISHNHFGSWVEELRLNGLTSLTDVSARFLGESDKILLLNGLKELTLGVAQGLSKSSSIRMELNGLKSMSREVAACFGTNRKLRILALNGITQISDEAMAELSGFGGWLSFGRLRQISERAAISLAGHGSSLHLTGLKELPDNIAAILSKHRGGHLVLTGVRSLSEIAAGHLSQYQGYLGLSGLEHLSIEVAAKLKLHRGELGLSGLTTLSIEAARILAQRTERVSLLSLRDISPEVAHVMCDKAELFWVIPGKFPDSIRELLETKFEEF